MRIIYFDCRNGVSGDMLHAAARGLLDDDRGHSHRSYAEVKDMIRSCSISPGAKEKALSIYAVIAEAEASVHGTTVEDVHFHEVGRRKAMENVIGLSACMDALGADKVLCSEICDGKGQIECSHGTIPVPAPAVMAMRERCGLVFTTDESVKTEMVTPTGLASLIGLGAVHCEGMPAGTAVRKSVAYGARDTGKGGGLTAYLLETT